MTRVGDRPGPAPAVANRAHLAHQPLRGATSDTNAFLVERAPDLGGAIDEQVRVIDPLDLDLQLCIAPRPLRWRPLLRHPVGVRGDLAAMLAEHPADRLDPEPRAMFVDERDHFLDWRSSSAPRKADAASRISFARRSSLFSHSSSFIGARSSVVSPGRRPWSTSARRTQSRSVSRWMSSFSATDSIASLHCDGYSCAWSSTIRIARSRSSSGCRCPWEVTASHHPLNGRSSHQNPGRFSPPTPLQPTRNPDKPTTTTASPNTAAIPSTGPSVWRTAAVAGAVAAVATTVTGASANAGVPLLVGDVEVQVRAFAPFTSSRQRSAASSPPRCSSAAASPGEPA
jgi:hypothetical protein